MSNNIPDLIKIGAIPSNTSIEIETDIIDVTNFDQRTARLLFASKGFLHPNSKLTLSVDTTGLTGRSFYSLNTGIASLLSRIRLSCGGQTLQEIDDFSNWYSYRSLFVDNEIQKNKELYTHSRCINHAVKYEDYNPDTSDSKGENVNLDIGKSGDYDPVSTISGYKLYDFQIVNNKAIFQINLSELCPMLKMNQMPLYLISPSNPLVLDLTFADVSGTDRCCIANGTGGSQTYNIKQEDVKIIADYIFYPQSFMDEYAIQNPSLTFTYMDYQLSKTSLTSVTAKSLIRNIGGNGRIVTKVITGLQSASSTQSSLLNKLVAVSPLADYSASLVADRKNGSLTANVKYNNEFLFPIDVTESSVLFHHTQQAEAVPPFILREEYNREGEYMGVDTLEGHEFQTDLAGQFFWQGFRLNKNERISSRGIELYYKYDGLDSTVSTYTQRAYLEVVKMATLTNGKMEITYA
jgi:hypothetical protein